MTRLSADEQFGPARHSLGYLDGLRGLAALIVVVHHFALIFYPTLLTGDAYTAHLGGVEQALASSPASILVGGNFAVCLFFVLSGLVLSEGYFRTGQLSDLQSQASRRYLRLMLPVAFSALVAWGLWLLGAYHNVEVAKLTDSSKFAEFWQERPTAGQLLRDLVSDIPLAGESSYNPVFWTLSLELLGSFVVFTLLALFGRLRHRGWLYGGALGLLWFSDLNFYICAFIIGVWLNDYRHHATKGSSLTGRWWPALLTAGLLLGSYPTASLIPFDDTLYRFLRSEGLTAERAIQLWHIVGAALIIAAVLRSGRLQRGLSGRGLRWLGNVSFSLYLLHFLVLGSFTSWLFLRLQGLLPYHAAVAVAGLVTVPVLAVVSQAMYRLVDLPGIQLGKSLYARFLRPEPGAPDVMKGEIQPMEEPAGPATASAGSRS